MQVRHRFPRTGEYEIAIALLCRLHGECDGSAGFPDMHQLLVLVDGAEVRSFTLEPRSHRSCDHRRNGSGGCDSRFTRGRMMWR